ELTDLVQRMLRPSTIPLGHLLKHVQFQHVVAYPLKVVPDIDLHNHQDQPSLKLPEPFSDALPYQHFEALNQIPHFTKLSDVEIMQSFGKPYLIFLYVYLKDHAYLN